MADILIIDDDEIMCECIERALMGAMPNNLQTRRFDNAIEAMTAVNEKVPDLVILDIVLSGPDGFSFLNELISYSDTIKIPVIVITSLGLDGLDLKHYGVRKILKKESMTPQEIGSSVQEILADAK